MLGQEKFCLGFWNIFRIFLHMIHYDSLSHEVMSGSQLFHRLPDGQAQRVGLREV